LFTADYSLDITEDELAGIVEISGSGVSLLSEGTRRLTELDEAEYILAFIKRYQHLVALDLYHTEIE